MGRVVAQPPRSPSSSQRLFGRGGGAVRVMVAQQLDQVLAALAAEPDTHLLAGGTDMMVEVNFGHRRPASVIALRNVTELRGWTRTDDTVRIGAGCTWTELMAPDFAALVPAMAEAARTVGSPQIRNAGTLGGNVATCSPAGDGLPVLSALNANVELASVRGRRTLSIHEFMVGVKRTAREPDELITAIEIPIVHGWQGYAKVGVRNAMVISTCGVCLHRDGSTVAVALGAVGPTILRAPDAEAWVTTQSLTDDVVAEFGQRVAAEARPIDDHRSTAQYRRHAIGVLASRLLTRALAS
jgi:CO/xanthine dehydrogenase FAD-binding subunit